MAFIVLIKIFFGATIPIPIKLLRILVKVLRNVGMHDSLSTVEKFINNKEI